MSIEFRVVQNMSAQIFEDEVEALLNEGFSFLYGPESVALTTSTQSTLCHVAHMSREN